MDLPKIEIDGIVITPKHGIYHCPFGCGKPGYPDPKWKTEKGARKHYESCSRRTKVVAERTAMETKKREEAVALAKHKIGDFVHFVREIILKDTHERRFNRMVRVRYEPVKRFDWGTAEIKSICSTATGAVYYNGGIWESDLYPAAEEAKAAAESRQKAWDEHVEFARMCR